MRAKNGRDATTLNSRCINITKVYQYDPNEGDIFCLHFRIGPINKGNM